MSEVHYYRPKMKLAKMLREPGGKTVAEAVKDANAGLESLSVQCLDEVDAFIGRIEATFAALPADFDAEALHGLYLAANGLIGLPGIVGLSELETAAYSLADLTDRMIAAGRFEREAVRVHVQALRLLRRPDALGVAGLGEVLAGLAQVRDKFRTIEDQATSA
jgi:hypothetical protein